jgi:uncharacterized protein YecT (DUF1311 family)
MKIPTLFATWTALVIMAVSLESKGQDPDFKPPGTEENAAVNQANTRLDAVYKRLMGKLDVDGQKPLKEAERSWIKWRDDEAMLMARVGGAVGGSRYAGGFCERTAQVNQPANRSLERILKAVRWQLMHEHSNA